MHTIEFDTFILLPLSIRASHSIRLADVGSWYPSARPWTGGGDQDFHFFPTLCEAFEKRPVPDPLWDGNLKKWDEGEGPMTAKRTGDAG